jgi:uncharacterized membrane protein YfcA
MGYVVSGVDPLIVVSGLGIGLLIGLTGVGGGTLMTPLLILLFGIKPVTAIGTDIAYAAVTKTFGGIKHWRQGTVDWKLSTWMAIGSLPASVLGVVALGRLEDAFGSSFDPVLLGLVAGALLLSGTAMLYRVLFVPRAHLRERESAALDRRERRAAIAVGAFVGFILGVTSAGSGALIAVALILIFRLTPHRTVGTGVFQAALLLWAAGLAHVVAGNVDYGLMGNILVGSVPGIWVGSHMSVRVPVEKLRVVMAIVILGSGLALASKAGAPIPTESLAAVPLVVLVYLVGPRLLRARARRRAALHVATDASSS